VTSDVTERRLRRRAAQQLFDELSDDYFNQPRVNRARMFGSEGLRLDTKFLAFIGREGQMIIKLPSAQAKALVSAGEGSAVRAGRTTTREWVGVPAAPRRPGVEPWRNLIADAYDYAAVLMPLSTTEQ